MQDRARRHGPASALPRRVHFRTGPIIHTSPGSARGRRTETGPRHRAAARECSPMDSQVFAWFPSGRCFCTTPPPSLISSLSMLRPVAGSDSSAEPTSRCRRIRHDASQSLATDASPLSILAGEGVSEKPASCKSLLAPFPSPVVRGNCRGAREA